MQTYYHYTYANKETLPAFNEDYINLTNCTRSLKDYFKELNSDLESFLNVKNRKISILDCGAGSGLALHDILNLYDDTQVSKCVGVSLHFFSNVHNLFTDHQNRVEWYLGKAENILPKMTEKFDVIVDVFGAYYYSSNRPLLIKEYHRLLKPDGKAYVRTVREQSFLLMNHRWVSLVSYTTMTSPETFEQSGQCFCITKKTDEYPIEDFVISRVQCAGASITSNLSRYYLKKGNAWRPISVYYRPSLTKSL